MRELWRDESGVTSVEYALLLALIVLAGIHGWQLLGDTVETTVVKTAQTIANAAG